MIAQRVTKIVPGFAVLIACLGLVIACSRQADTPAARKYAMNRESMLAMEQQARSRQGASVQEFRRVQQGGPAGSGAIDAPASAPETPNEPELNISPLPPKPSTQPATRPDVVLPAFPSGTQPGTPPQPSRPITPPSIHQPGSNVQPTTTTVGVIGRGGSHVHSIPVTTHGRMDMTARRPLTAGGTGGIARAYLAYPTGDRATSVLLLEKITPTEVPVTAEFDYTIQVTNLTRHLALNNVEIHEVTSGGVEIRSSSPSAAGAQGNEVMWRLGRLGPEESRIIQVRSVLNQGGALDFCARATYQAELCLTIHGVQPDIRLAKWIIPAGADPTPKTESEVLACQPFLFKLAISNGGTGTARNLVIRDLLPDGLLTTDFQQEIKIPVDSLRSGQVREYIVRVNAQGSGVFANAARVEQGGRSMVKSNEVKAIVRRPVLALQKVSPRTRYIGRYIEYDITVHNNGDGVAYNTVIRDEIPEGTSFVKATENGRLHGNQVVWNIGTLPPGEQRTVRVALRAERIATVVSRTLAEALCANTVETRAHTKLSGVPAVKLEVIDINDPVLVGENETYVITVTNQGSAPTTNIQLVCDLEESMEFVSSDGPTRASTEGRKITFGALHSLAPRTKATWRVVVKAIQPGDARFHITMLTDQIQGPVAESESTTFYE